MPGPKPIYTARFELGFKPAMKGELEQVAAYLDWTVADVVREACRQYLAKPKAKNRRTEAGEAA